MALQEFWPDLDNGLQGMFRSGELIPGAAAVRFCASSSGAYYSYWSEHLNETSGGDGRLHTTISAAHDATTTGRNDTVILSPDNHSQASALTWSRDLTHFVGAFPQAMMNQRSRIGHSANMATMLTVSGYGNLFKNLYFMYGRGSATNLNLLTVSGDRNSFVNCHFGGPMNATEGDESGFDLVRLNCGEVYFRECTFGIETINWTDGDMLRVYGPADRSTRAYFKNCLFLMRADNAQVNFIETVSGNGAGFLLFDNCSFLNTGTALTYAIDGAGLGTNTKIFFNNSAPFAGATDIVAAGNEANVYFSHGGYVSADKLNNGIATNPDVA